MGGKNVSLPSDGVVENATWVRNESIPLIENESLGKWRPLDETEILKAAKVSKVNNSGDDAGSKKNWTKKDVNMPTQNRSRRSAWEINTKKPFDLSTPVRNILVERKLRSAEGTDDKIEEKNDKETDSKVYQSTMEITCTIPFQALSNLKKNETHL